MQPILAAAIECVTQCKTIAVPKADEQPSQQMDLPRDFGELILDPSFRSEFEVAVQALPPELRESLTQRPGGEATGSLSKIIVRGNAKTYLYSLVRFNPPGTSRYYSDIAVDVVSKKVAILVQPTPDLDQYYLTGPGDLQAALLIEAAASDLQMAKQAVKVARDPSANYDWNIDPFILPFKAGLAEEVVERLTYLNTKYSNGRLRDVGPTEDLIIAKRIKAQAAWFVANLNFSQCDLGMSPAARIKTLQESGVMARTSDKTDTSGNLTEVEVSYDSGGQERYYQYFKSKAACEASLSHNQAIPDRYL